MKIKRALIGGFVGGLIATFLNLFVFGLDLKTSISCFVGIQLFGTVIVLYKYKN